MLFVFFSILQGCTLSEQPQKKKTQHKENKESKTIYAEIGNTSTVTRNGYTYTCTNMGNHYVKCVGPPLEE